MSPRPSTVQATWTSKRREAWPPHSDLNNNRYVPFEWKPHKQEGNLEDEICAAETPCAGHSNEFHLFCEYPEQCHVPLRAAHRHLSYFLRSLVGAFYTTTNRLSIFDTSLPIEKNQTMSTDLENMMESLSGIAGQMSLQQPAFAMGL